MLTFEMVERGYANMWQHATVKADKVGAATGIARKIIANKDKYEAVEAKTGVPWFMIGPIHNRESSLSFTGVLHNGDKIIGTGQRTTHVPKGRGPFATWSDSAIDALTMPPHQLQKITNWSIARILYETERYNGFGYFGKINSPYVWSFTSEQQRGKYVADGRFDPKAMDTQAGCAAILKALVELDASVATRVNPALLLTS